MKRQIKYIAHFDVLNSQKYERIVSPAAVDKIQYIYSVLNYIGYDVEIISPAIGLRERNEPGNRTMINAHTALKLFRSLPRRTIFERYASAFWRRFSLFWYLLLHIHKGDCVLVYHSLGYMNTISCLKKLRDFRLILEVEEIYGDVSEDKGTTNNEIKFFQHADVFIFPTILLNEKVNKGQKPYSVVHGTYALEFDRNCKFHDGEVHCVYAGTLDPRKGGSAAAAAAEFLDRRYHVHIIGFGNEKDKKELLDTIERVSKKTKCKLTYDGLKSGEDYIRFIQSCDIGLSTQNPDAAFNNTSFPSKILSYMANGLRVVSIRIPAIERSAIGRHMYYYDEQTPQKIANAIMAVDMRDVYDSRRIIKELDDKFAKQIEGLVNGL